MNEVIKDVINPHHLAKFSGLIRSRIPGMFSARSLAIGDHLLFFNGLNSAIGRDGYFDHQSPRNLLKDPNCVYLRRVWAKGQIEVLKPLSLGQEYACRESVRFIKRIRSDHYVCLERMIVGSSGESLVRELRTLAYTNLPPRTRNTSGIDGTSLGTFTFQDLDIIIYGQLSSNPHRIHWDRRYSLAVEGYRDIIVQGPFALQVLLKFAEAAIGSPITKVEYRNYNCIYADTEVEVKLLPRQGQYQVCMRDAKRPEIIFLQAMVSCQ
ncbi:hypothetical protein HG537_0E03000 [Torulaspora globosa]|uniref:MaoC-like domain-containing protein n=1 Tax=Torulaspora globosa TaxID=48254 RepID=A0A7H9HWU3_9SACH|nr:hypothetical protein HG537_0E03000 [Torulaspora sp. CBS 2947]